MTEESSKPIRLLLADDEEDLVTFLAHRLGKRGLEVATALSGEEALDAAEERIFDVAVVDLKMPDMDGITVIEELKRMQPYVEVLMLTGHGSHDSAWEAGRLHAFRYIMKPCDFDELLDLVLEIQVGLGRRRKGQRAERGRGQGERSDPDSDGHWLPPVAGPRTGRGDDAVSDTESDGAR